MAGRMNLFYHCQKKSALSTPGGLQALALSHVTFSLVDRLDLDNWTVQCDPKGCTLREQIGYAA